MTEPAPEWLLGTWRLVSVTREDIRTGAKVDFFGPNPIGYITYSADHRMMVVIVRSGRQKPAGASATAAEADALFKSLVSYAGTYSIDRNQITHHVEVSWNESWTGTHQTRLFRREGSRLALDTPPSPDPVDGMMSVRSMVWERPA
jgi:Lipocalin-like domain